jgi:hypothetical protein
VVEADTAGVFGGVDERNGHAHIGRQKSGGVSTGTRSDDSQLRFVVSHEFSSLFNIQQVSTFNREPFNNATDFFRSVEKQVQGLFQPLADPS